MHKFLACFGDEISAKWQLLNIFTAYACSCQNVVCEDPVMTHLVVSEELIMTHLVVRYDWVKVIFDANTTEQR